jgi:hypothetical protein
VLRELDLSRGTPYEARVAPHSAISRFGAACHDPTIRRVQRQGLTPGVPDVDRDTLAG